MNAVVHIKDPDLQRYPTEEWCDTVARLAEAYYVFLGLPQNTAYAEDLARRVADIRIRLIDCRGIVVPWKRVVGIYKELLGLQYEQWRWPAAEAWILRRSWQYVSPKTLSIDMFFPLPSDVKDLLGENFIARSQHEKILREACAKSYHSGRTDEQRERKAAASATHAQDSSAGMDTAKHLLKAKNDLWDLEEKMASQEQEHQKAIASLERRNASLEFALNQLRDTTAQNNDDEEQRSFINTIEGNVE